MKIYLESLEDQKNKNKKYIIKKQNKKQISVDSENVCVSGKIHVFSEWENQLYRQKSICMLGMSESFHDNYYASFLKYGDNDLSFRLGRNNQIQCIEECCPLFHIKKCVLEYLLEDGFQLVGRRARCMSQPILGYYSGKINKNNKNNKIFYKNKLHKNTYNKFSCLENDDIELFYTSEAVKSRTSKTFDTLKYTCKKRRIKWNSVSTAARKDLSLDDLDLIASRYEKYVEQQIHQRNPVLMELCKRKRRKIRRKRIAYTRQSGDEQIPSESLLPVELDSFASKVMQAFRDIKPHIDQFGPQVYAVLEHTALLIAGLALSESTASAALHIINFIKHVTGKSIGQGLMDLLNEIFPCSEFKNDDEQTVTRQSGDEQRPEWLQTMKSSFANWKLLSMNPIFGRISTFISLIVTLGICSEKSFTFTVQGVKLFQPNVIDIQKDSTSIFDAILGTFIYFVEGGYMFFVHGDTTSLLYSDVATREFDKESSELMALSSLATTGNLMRVKKMQPQAYHARLTKAISNGKKILDTMTDKVLKSFFFARVAKLEKLLVDYQLYLATAGIRHSPFCVEIVGKSGVGKSTIAQLVMVSCLAAGGYGHAPEDLCNINPSDKYWSTFSSSKTGIFIDDMGNTKAEHVQEAPTKLLLDICNNVKICPPMADLESKGKMSVEPRVCVITTNVKDLDAFVYSNEPASIARRAHVVLTVSVKEDFKTSDAVGKPCGLLDAAKAIHGKSEDGIDDFWNITAQTVIPVETSSTDTFAYINFQDQDGKQMENVSLRDALKLCTTLAKKHYAEQIYVVERYNDAASKMTLCPKGCGLNALCTCADDLSFVPAPFSQAVHRVPPKKRTFGKAMSLQTTMDRVRRPKPRLEWAQRLVRWGIPAEAAAPFAEYVSPGYIVGTAMRTTWEYTGAALYKSMLLSTYDLEVMASGELIKLAKDLSRNFLYRWCEYVPQSWLHNPYFKVAILKFLEPRAYMIAREHVLTAGILAGILPFSVRASSDAHGILEKYIPRSRLKYLLWLLLKSAPWLVSFAIMRRLCWAGLSKRLAWDDLVKRNTAFNALENDNHKTIIQTGMLVVGVFAVVYTAVKLYRGVISAWTVAQGLSPTNESDIIEREKHVNPYKKPMLISTPKTQRQKTTNSAHLVDKCFTNLIYLKVWLDGRYQVCNAFMLTTNVLLMPSHMWPRHEAVFKLICKRNGDNNGSAFEVLADSSTVVHIPETDFVLVYAPKSGSYASLVDFLPIEDIPEGYNNCVYKMSDGERCSFTATLCPQMVCHDGGKFLGAKAICSMETFKGMCMAVYVSESKGSLISGFHLGGVCGLKYAVIGKITQKQALSAISTLSEQAGTLIMVQGGDFPDTICGKKVLQSQQLPLMHIANITEGGTWCVYGITGVSKTEKSMVVENMLSPHVEEVMGIPNVFGPPKMSPNWKHYARFVDKVAHAALGVRPKLLSRACDDWKAPLLCKVTQPFISSRVKPLTDMEALCGIDGRRFIDALQMNTSVGFPLSGPKTPYIQDLNPKDYPGFATPRRLLEPFLSEYNRIIGAMKKGERAYAIFSANLKDEPTKVTKNKVRCFQSCPMALSIAVRKWFLPLCWFMSTYPLDTEIAVGINCYGPEWNEMIQHVCSFGEDRVFAGDYADYDMTQPIQVILAAFKCLIDIAAASGNYSEEDLLIMRGLASEIADPYISVAGALYSFSGGNPSGHNLTVYINSIVNCLMHRCSFFEHNEGVFRDNVALITYGDDFLASVSPKVKYDHIVFATSVKEYGMVVTMEDKVSDPVPFSPLRTTSFLKRLSRKDPVMGEVAPLAESSIVKSLHSNVKSKHVTARNLAIDVMTGAIREWFLHGPEVYELRRTQLKIISDRVKLVVPDLEFTYQQRLNMWIEQYKTPHQITSGSANRVAMEQVFTTFVFQAGEDPSVISGLGSRFYLLPNNYDITEIKWALQEPYLLGTDVPERQSGNINSYSTDSPQHKEQIVSFKDEEPGFITTIDSFPDRTAHITHKSDSDLGAFFSRPLKIQEYTWTIGAAFNEEFNPWQDVFENPRVVNRMCNFRLLKAKMCVKIMINGNGFYYGRAIAAYTPLFQY